MSPAPPLLVVVSGPPASGKTTLARRLAADLCLPLINKDGFKESLFASLGWQDARWSQRLGMASIALLYHVAEQLLAAGLSLIVEANFDSFAATEDFRRLQQTHPFEPFQIQCGADGATLLQRFLARDQSPERHPGHVDAERHPELETILLKGRHEPLEIGGTLVEVDTTDFAAVDYAGLRRLIAARLPLVRKRDRQGGANQTQARHLVTLRAAYPTSQHEQAARAIVDFFAAQPEPDSVLLVNSCARGRATRDSCLDVAVLVAPEVSIEQQAALERRWEAFLAREPAFAALAQVGAFSEVHLDVIDGRFSPREREWTSGPDDFEVEIGNRLAYSVPLWQRGDYYRRLQERWLPYYDEDLRRERLAMVLTFCRNNLAHIPLYVARGLYFQAFDRLYNAYREFLQALFIARRTYPIAYDKWIREQIVEILGLPELYQELPRLFEIGRFESEELSEKAQVLEALVETYVSE